MNKKFERIIAGILAILMVATSVPSSSWAAELMPNADAAVSEYYGEEESALAESVESCTDETVTDESGTDESVTEETSVEETSTEETLTEETTMEMLPVEGTNRVRLVGDEECYIRWSYSDPSTLSEEPSFAIESWIEDASTKVEAQKDDATNKYVVNIDADFEDNTVYFAIFTNSGYPDAFFLNNADSSRIFYNMYFEGTPIYCLRNISSDIEMNYEEKSDSCITYQLRFIEDFPKKAEISSDAGEKSEINLNADGYYQLQEEEGKNVYLYVTPGDNQKVVVERGYGTVINPDSSDSTKYNITSVNENSIEEIYIRTITNAALRIDNSEYPGIKITPTKGVTGSASIGYKTTGEGIAVKVNNTKKQEAFSIYASVDEDGAEEYELHYNETDGMYYLWEYQLFQILRENKPMVIRVGKEKETIYFRDANKIKVYRYVPKFEDGKEVVGDIDKSEAIMYDECDYMDDYCFVAEPQNENHEVTGGETYRGSTRKDYHFTKHELTDSEGKPFVYFSFQPYHDADVVLNVEGKVCEECEFIIRSNRLLEYTIDGAEIIQSNDSHEQIDEAKWMCNENTRTVKLTVTSTHNYVPMLSLDSVDLQCTHHYSADNKDEKDKYVYILNAADINSKFLNLLGKETFGKVRVYFRDDARIESVRVLDNNVEVQQPKMLVGSDIVYHEDEPYSKYYEVNSYSPISILAKTIDGYTIKKINIANAKSVTGNVVSPSFVGNKALFTIAADVYVNYEYDSEMSLVQLETYLDTDFDHVLKDYWLAKDKYVVNCSDEPLKFAVKKGMNINNASTFEAYIGNKAYSDGLSYQYFFKSDAGPSYGWYNVFDPSAYAGKTVTLKFSYYDYDSKKTLKKSITVKVNPLPKTVNIKGADKNGNMTIPAGSSQTYDVQFDKNTDVAGLSWEFVTRNANGTVVADENEADKYIKGLVTEYDTVNCRCTLSVKAFSEAYEIDPSQQLTVRFYYSDSEKNKVYLKDKKGNDTFTISQTTSAIETFKPTVKLLSATDVSLNVSATVPKGCENCKNLYVRFKVVPKDAEKAQQDGYFYEPFECDRSIIDGAATATITCTNEKELGNGVAEKYDVSASIIQAKNNEEYELKIVARSKESKAVTMSTKAPAYASSISLKKGTTKFYPAETRIGNGVKLATIQYSKDTTYYLDDNQIESYVSVTRSDNSSTVNSVRRNFSIIGNDIYARDFDSGSGSEEVLPGEYTLTVMAPNGQDGQGVPKVAKIKFTVQKCVRHIEFDRDTVNLYKPGNKAVTFSQKPIGYYDYSYKDISDDKKVKWSIDYDVDGLNNLWLSDYVSVDKNGKVTVKKDLNLKHDNRRNKFRVRAEYPNSDVDSFYTINLSSVTSVPKTVALVDENGDLTQDIENGEIAVDKLKGMYLAAFDESAERIDDVTWKCNSKNVVLGADGKIEYIRDYGKYTFTATTTDGTKKSAALKLKVTYPESVTLSADISTDMWGEIVFEQQKHKETGNPIPGSFIGTNPVSRDDAICVDCSLLSGTDQKIANNVKISVSGGKVISSEYDDEYIRHLKFIPNKAQSVVTLRFGDETYKYTIVNEDFNRKQYDVSIDGPSKAVTLMANHANPQPLIINVSGLNPELPGSKLYCLDLKCSPSDMNKKNYDRISEQFEQKIWWGKSRILDNVVINENDPTKATVTVYCYGAFPAGTYNIYASVYEVDRSDSKGKNVSRTKKITLKYATARKPAVTFNSKPIFEFSNGAEACITKKITNGGRVEIHYLFNNNVNGQLNNFRDYFECTGNYTTIRVKDDVFFDEAFDPKKDTVGWAYCYIYNEYGDYCDMKPVKLTVSFAKPVLSVDLSKTEDSLKDQKDVVLKRTTISGTFTEYSEGVFYMHMAASANDASELTVEAYVYDSADKTWGWTSECVSKEESGDYKVTLSKSDYKKQKIRVTATNPMGKVSKTYTFDTGKNKVNFIPEE